MEFALAARVARGSIATRSLHPVHFIVMPEDFWFLSRF